MVKNCEICGQEFKTSPSRIKKGGGRFCSMKCQGLWRAKSGITSGEKNYFWNGGCVKTTCLVCGVQFETKPSQLKKNKGKMCSKKCFSEWVKTNGHFNGATNPNWNGGVGRVTISVNCHVCGKPFGARKTQIKNGQGKYCSPQCKGKSVSGENSPLWRGGSKKYPKTFNMTFKKTIRKRDNFTCAVCLKSPAVEVHHIDYVKENTYPENCITLCRSCHSKIRSNPQYWLDYLKPLAINRTITNEKRNS